MNTSIFLKLFILQTVVHAYKPLGSKPPEECSTIRQNCPSHYMCIEKEPDSKMGTCICDRLYGFYGHECREISFAGYEWLIICAFSSTFAAAALVYNISFMILMYKHDKMTHNNLRSMIFNSLAIMFVITGTLSSVLVTLEVDRDNESAVLFPIVLCGGFTFWFLSSMGISIYWVEIIEKVVHRRNKQFQYKLLLYAVSLVYVIIIFLFLVLVSNVALVGVVGALIVGYSYNYGGNKVVLILRASSAEYELGSPKRQHVLELADKIEETARVMTRCNITLIVGMFIVFFTACTPTPIYAQQNNLPRALQSQPARFLNIGSMIVMNVQIVKYYHFAIFRGTHVYVPLKGHHLIQILWCMFWGRNKPTRVDVDCEQELPELQDTSLSQQHIMSSGFNTEVTETVQISSNRDASGVYMIAPQKTGPSDNRIVRVAVPKGATEAGSLENVNGVAQFMPLLLVTVDLQTHRARCRTVVDYGDGNFVDIDENDEDEGTSSHLNPGSHAFVRCYGESFLRCTLESFRFSCAGGHPLLANFSQVLMAGEIEVNEHGTVTRWLNKSGLYMPPRFMIGQAGLPFDLAWVYMSEVDVLALDESKRQELITCGSLVKVASGIPRKQYSTATRSVSSSEFFNDVESQGRGEGGGLGITSVHAMDTWIVKASDDLVWQPTISSVAYQTAKESVAKFHRFKQKARRRIRRLRSHPKVQPTMTSPMDVFGGKIVLDDEISKSRARDKALEQEKEDLSSAAEHECLDNMPPLPAVDGNTLAAISREDRISGSDQSGGSSGNNEDENGSILFELDEERMIRARVKAMRREMEAAGVFDTHRKGATERSKHKKELGFSKTMQLK